VRSLSIQVGLRPHIYEMLTTFNEVDMTGLMEVCNAYNVSGDHSSHSC
jgi:hypothetical protein